MKHPTDEQIDKFGSFITRFHVDMNNPDSLIDHIHTVVSFYMLLMVNESADKLTELETLHMVARLQKVYARQLLSMRDNPTEKAKQIYEIWCAQIHEGPGLQQVSIKEVDLTEEDEEPILH